MFLHQRNHSSEQLSGARGFFSTVGAFLRDNLADCPSFPPRQFAWKSGFSSATVFSAVRAFLRDNLSSCPGILLPQFVWLFGHSSTTVYPGMIMTSVKCDTTYRSIPKTELITNTSWSTYIFGIFKSFNLRHLWICWRLNSRNLQVQFRAWQFDISMIENKKMFVNDESSLESSTGSISTVNNVWSQMTLLHHQRWLDILITPYMVVGDHASVHSTVER